MGRITDIIRIQHINDERPEVRQEAIGQLFSDPSILLKFKEIAARHGRPGHTWRPTALVSEAWLKLSGAQQKKFNDIQHLFNWVAVAMRRAVQDDKRGKSAAMRGGGRERVEPDIVAEGKCQPEDPPVDAETMAIATEALELLEQLAQSDPRAAKCFYLRHMEEYDVEEVASKVAIARRTVQEDVL